MDYCMGYSQPFKILFCAEAQKHAKRDVQDSPRLDSKDKCHPFQKGGRASGKNKAYF